MLLKNYDLMPIQSVFFDNRYAYVMKCLKSRTIFTFSWLVLNVLTLCSHESGHFFHWTIGQTVPKSPMQNTLPMLNAELSYQCHFNHSKTFYHSYMAGLLTHSKCIHGHEILARLFSTMVDKLYHISLANSV